MFKTIRNSLFSLIYPQECRVCSLQVEKYSDGVACGNCWQATRLFNGTEMLCNKCGAYLGDKAAPIPVFCRKCDDHFYDRAVACGAYEGALAAAIVNMKNTPALTQRLKTTISTLSLDILNSTDLFVPIPLSAHRRIERGYNQAEIIAEAFSRSTGIPVDAHSLARKRHTSVHRMRMDQKARELSVKNAFEVTRPKLIVGKNILLVDDVLTSGATASACAKSLEKTEL